MTPEERHNHNEHRKNMYKNFTPEQKEKHLERCRAYRKKNKEKLSKMDRKKWLRHYGLTQDEYDQMFLEQHGVCFLCKRTDTRRLSVDHNHFTGKVRKLLCTKCNAGLGNFDESISVMEQAIQYLKVYQS